VTGGHHHGTATGAHRGRLAAVLAITVAVLLIEVVGGLLAGSLALLADAGHMLTDTAGLGFALFAATLAQRPPTARRTFGWQRLEILAAVGNAVLLLVVAGLVLLEAARRADAPPEVEGGLMLGVAAVGLAANAVSLWLLHRGQKESLNVRGAYLEVLGDLLGSAAVVVAAIVIAVSGWRAADLLASVLVGVLILPRTWVLLRDSVDILLEATPRHVDLDHVRSHILDIPGVRDVHDLHVWTITSGVPVLSAHVVVVDHLVTDGCGGQVLDQLGDCLAHHFDVGHCTFQLEPAKHRDHEQSVHH
jgi:cobalt-zinc-cadmium efflux system protein